MRDRCETLDPVLGQTGPTRAAFARARAGLTQAQVAEAVGVNRKTISRIERGETRPRLGLALRLADVLGVSFEELFGEAA